MIGGVTERWLNSITPMVTCWAVLHGLPNTCTTRTSFRVQALSEPGPSAPRASSPVDEPVGAESEPVMKSRLEN